MTAHDGLLVDGDGTTWVTADRGARELGDDVNAALIRSWASSRRQLVTGRRGGDGRTWYRLTDLRAVEARTCGRTRPRTTRTAA